MQSFLGWMVEKRPAQHDSKSFPDKVGRYIEVFGGAGWVLFGRDPVLGQWKYSMMLTANSSIFTAASNTIQKPCKKNWMGCLIRVRFSLTMPLKNIYEE